MNPDSVTSGARASRASVGGAPDAAGGVLGALYCFSDDGPNATGPGGKGAGEDVAMADARAVVDMDGACRKMDVDAPDGGSRGGSGSDSMTSTWEYQPDEPQAGEPGGEGCAGREGGGPGTQDAAMMNEVVRSAHGERLGVTKWFSDRLGYGFITEIRGENQGLDLFVHFSSIHPLNNTHRTLRKGEYVSFDVGENNGGLQAVFVTGLLGGPLMCDHVDCGAPTGPGASVEDASADLLQAKTAVRDRRRPRTERV